MANEEDGSELPDPALVQMVYDLTAPIVLRDVFAALAMHGLIDRWGPATIPEASKIAAHAYFMADAMLKAREKQ